MSQLPWARSELICTAPQIEGVKQAVASPTDSSPGVLTLHAASAQFLFPMDPNGTSSFPTKHNTQFDRKVRSLPSNLCK